MSTSKKIEPAASHVVDGRLEPARRKRGPRRSREAYAENVPSRAALMLVLAHHIQRAIDAGEIRDQAEAAHRLGMTRARLTQILDLTLLAIPIQEAILAAKLETGAFQSERALRGLHSGY